MSARHSPPTRSRTGRGGGRRWGRAGNPGSLAAPPVAAPPALELKPCYRGSVPVNAVSAASLAARIGHLFVKRLWQPRWPPSCVNWSFPPCCGSEAGLVIASALAATLAKAFGKRATPAWQAQGQGFYTEKSPTRTSVRERRFEQDFCPVEPRFENGEC